MGTVILESLIFGLNITNIIIEIININGIRIAELLINKLLSSSDEYLKNCVGLIFFISENSEYKLSPVPLGMFLYSYILVIWELVF